MYINGNNVDRDALMQRLEKEIFKTGEMKKYA